MLCVCAWVPPGLIGMSLCVPLLSRIICSILAYNHSLCCSVCSILAFNHSLYCSVSIPFSFVYFIAFLVIFKHSIITAMSTSVTTPYLCSRSVFVQPFTDEGGCIVTETSELL